MLKKMTSFSFLPQADGQAEQAGCWFGVPPNMGMRMRMHFTFGFLENNCTQLVPNVPNVPNVPKSWVHLYLVRVGAFSKFDPNLE